VTRILLVEDDENLRVALADNLQAAGYEVVVGATGADARAEIGREPVDLVVLDLMLPDTDGYRLCRELRDAQTDTRILMLTARSLDEDVVRGFEAGADDYVTKPYRLALLLARVRALLRRGAPGSPKRQDTRLRFGEFVLDSESRIVTRAGGAVVDLTRKEFDLLRYFLLNAGRALARQQILDDVWGADLVIDERTIDNFVSSTKKKLGWKSGCGFRFVTVRGVGYRLELEE
jgi:two-component system, OmpR family, phosphate regulon response regulator PhoB